MMCSREELGQQHWLQNTTAIIHIIQAAQGDTFSVQ